MAGRGSKAIRGRAYRLSATPSVHRIIIQLVIFSFLRRHIQSSHMPTSSSPRGTFNIYYVRIYFDERIFIARKYRRMLSKRSEPTEPHVLHAKQLIQNKQSSILNVFWMSSDAFAAGTLVSHKDDLAQVLCARHESARSVSTQRLFIARSTFSGSHWLWDRSWKRDFAIKHVFCRVQIANGECATMGRP